MKSIPAFDARRLTVARWAAELTKRDLADRSGVSPASISQYEAGNTTPPPVTLARLALACGVPTAYFLGSPGRRTPDLAARSFFRSLRSTPQRERDRADALAEHAFDIVQTLDRVVNVPIVNVPHIAPVVGDRAEIEDIAEQVRQRWSVPAGPVANVLRLLEANGVIAARLSSGGRSLDAFSRWFGDRPLLVLWSDKGDKARSRFDAAHELAHLVMHPDAEPLVQEQERQANLFASAFLMPATEVGRDLIHRTPTLNDWPEVLARRAKWGVSAKALLYRSRELGALPDVAFRRAMQNYARRRLKDRDGSELGPPEQPVVLHRALEAAAWSFAEIAGLTALPEQQVAEIICGRLPG